jgi:hypothetical protein
VAGASEVEPGLHKVACEDIKFDAEDFMCATVNATVD